VPPAASVAAGSPSSTLNLVVTVDTSKVQPEDRDLEPIMREIEPQLEALLESSDLAIVSVEPFGPRSIVVEADGDAATVVPQIQQLIDGAGYEIPLVVSQFANQ
jgi:hypothetical protein